MDKAVQFSEDAKTFFSKAYEGRIYKIRTPEVYFFPDRSSGEKCSDIQNLKESVVMILGIYWDWSSDLSTTGNDITCKVLCGSEIFISEFFPQQGFQLVFERIQ